MSEYYDNNNYVPLEEVDFREMEDNLLIINSDDERFQVLQNIFEDPVELEEYQYCLGFEGIDIYYDKRRDCYVAKRTR